MFRINIVLIVFVLTLGQLLYSAGNNQKSFYEMSNHEIDSVLKTTSKTDLTISEKMNFFSSLFLGTHYNLKCTGDGPHALLENWPLVNFKETNCMVFCEHVLAMAISDYWDNFFNNLQQIRYRDGFIGMKTRNHYTMADWLPQNRWILDDVSRKIGAEHTKSVTRTISHKTFFANKGIGDMADVLPDREITVEYIPLDALDKIEPKTRPGDILALLFANKTNIFSAHMLMIAEKDGKKFIRESSSSRMTTFDTPYAEWVKDKQENWSKKYIGLAFMRVKESLNTPGKIIKPWDIPSLK